MSRPSTPHRRVLPAGLALAVCLGTSACTPPPPPPHDAGGLALVVGGRNNMPRPTIAAKARDVIAAAVLSKDTLFIIGVSGRPQVLYTERIDHDCDSERACDAVVDDYLGKIGGLVAAVKAQAAEADQLGAIALAADQLNGLSGTGPKQVVVIDNGLQTTGKMPLQAPGALAVDPREQAEHIVADHALPSLRDIDVLLSGLGSRYDPQPGLSRDALSRVRTLWSTILESAGARVTVDPSPLDESLAPSPAQPPVAPVVLDEKPEPDTSHCYRIRDDQVGFLPGKDRFRDPAAAREVLTPIAADLKTLNVTVSVVGTTALPEDPPYPLSTKRAKRVATVLSELGVPRNAMLTNGVSTNFSGFQPDTDADGNLIPALAMQNRLVLITPVGRSCSS